MSRIEVTRDIPQPPDLVYAAATKVNEFTKHMPNLKRAAVVEEGDGFVVSEWRAFAEVMGMKRDFNWTKRDVWDDAKMRCDFTQVKGDLKSYAGSWTFGPAGEGKTRVVLTLDFVLGIPMLGAMVVKLVEQTLKKNCEDLLAALEKIAAASAQPPG